MFFCAPARNWIKDLSAITAYDRVAYALGISFGGDDGRRGDTIVIIFRDVEIRVGKHAWHVFPLEGFGFLLGRNEPEDMRIYAALPCSKTECWDEYGDRWNGIDEYLGMAQRVARLLDLEVAGLYATTESFDHNSYPLPEYFVRHKMKLMMLYRAMCCRSHSHLSLWRNGHWLEFGKDGSAAICRGKRLSNNLNQKKIMKQWRKIYGPVDYSNNYKEGLYHLL